MEKQKTFESLTQGVFILDKDEFSRFIKKYPLYPEQIIHPNWRYLPFLTIKENLAIDNSKKSHLTMDHLLKLLDLMPTLLEQKNQSLTLFEKIKCQLLQKLLTKKETIVFAYAIDALSIAEKQQLLSICERLVQDYQLTIYILSDDANLLRLKFH